MYALSDPIPTIPPNHQKPFLSLSGALEFQMFVGQSFFETYTLELKN